MVNKLYFSVALSLLATIGLWAGHVNAQLYGRAEQDQAGLSASRQAPENILIILDASDSMNEEMNGQRKIDIAKNVVLNTVKNLPPHVNVGLRVYGHKRGSGSSFITPFGNFSAGADACKQTQLMVPIAANNRASIASELMDIQAVGKTPISFTLQQAINNDLSHLPGKKTIILVSDGRETCAFNPCDVSLNMVRSGVDVKINTIGFGTHDRVADDQLKCVALATKGRFYTADTAAELAKSLQDSAQVQTSVQAKIYSGP